MKPEVKRTLLLLLAITAILMVLYFWIPEQFQFSYMPIVYLAVGAALALFYVIYNRGLSGRNVTLDMLPDSMTLEEKQKFISESKERLRKTKWVLLILIPIILVFAADMIYLFVVPILMGGAK